MTFDEGTKTEIKNILESLVNTGKRIRLWYGDDNGRSWEEEFDTIGYIGRSTGPNKIPLLINNSRSYGGGAILTARIIKIVETKTKRVLYQHPNFHQYLYTAKEGSEIERYTATVYRNDGFYANCTTLTEAERLAAFMNGLRMSK
jgi:hypothetical protein